MLHVQRCDRSRTKKALSSLGPHVPVAISPSPVPTTSLGDTQGSYYYYSVLHRMLLGKDLDHSDHSSGHSGGDQGLMSLSCRLHALPRVIVLASCPVPARLLERTIDPNIAPA